MATKKKISSSYYAMSKRFPMDVVQVGISLVIPHWWSPEKKQTENRLAPNKEDFKKPDWKERYQAKMDRIGNNGILQATVDRIPDGAVILCFEKDPDECHRKLALEAMIKYCNVEGGEWAFPERDIPKKNKKPDIEQPSLF